MFKSDKKFIELQSVLVKQGFDIGKSPSCVFSMIKKFEKRDKILSQKTTVELGKIEVKLLWTIRGVLSSLRIKYNTSYSVLFPYLNIMTYYL